MEKVKGYLIDVDKAEHRLVMFDDSVEEIVKLLNCSVFTVVYRYIGNKEYVIYCDDEGLLKREPRVSAVDSKHEVQLVGNLLIARNGYGGVTESLDDSDIQNIKQNILGYIDCAKGQIRPILGNVEFEEA